MNGPNGSAPLAAAESAVAAELRSADSWLIDAADLLAEPDPGPTPWLVDGLIVDQSIAAAAGRWKTTKSWAMLEISVSVATGQPAFGVAHVATPGPVVYVIEESGKAALWRRLDALCRGRNVRPEVLRDRLKLAANARVRLDDPEWQERLLRLGAEVRPRAFIFDPLARMKAPDREESGQSDMAVVIEYLRLLRDESQAATVFVHHNGHNGEHMRGTSDLESVWESRLTFKRDNGAVTIKAEHREAESDDAIAYRLDYHRETGTMRLRPTVPPLAERIVDHLRDHGPMGTADVAKGVETRRSDVERELARLADAGTIHRAPSGKRDASGRVIVAKVWHLSEQARLHPLHPVPSPGSNGSPNPEVVTVSAPRPTPLGVGRGRGTAPDEQEHR